jgi:hypothetical protein
VKLRVTPIVNQMLQEDLGRTLWLRSLLRLTVELPLKADRYRHNRDPDDADCFLYPALIVEQASKRYWRFMFAVDDTREQELRVIGYSHLRGTIG